MEIKELKRILAKNVRVLRAENKITQLKLSILTGVSEKTIVSIEKETSNPTIETLNDIANAFNVPLERLFK